MLPSTLRDRTVIPRTRAMWRTMRWPAISLVVETSTGFSLPRRRAWPAGRYRSGPRTRGGASKRRPPALPAPGNPDTTADEGGRRVSQSPQDIASADIPPAATPQEAEAAYERFVW